MRIDAMRIYLEENDWMQSDVSLNSFNIVNFKEHFLQTENLSLEQAIDAVRVYDKINHRQH
jgi:hypothetical protein